MINLYINCQLNYDLNIFFFVILASERDVVFLIFQFEIFLTTKHQHTKLINGPIKNIIRVFSNIKYRQKTACSIESIFCRKNLFFGLGHW